MWSMLSEVDTDLNEHEESQRTEHVSLLSGANTRAANRYLAWLSSVKSKLETNVWTKLALIAFKEVIWTIWEVILFQALQSKRSLWISFLGCLLVVVVVSSLITLILNAPVVFLKMAEAEEGEIDVRITSKQSDTTLNFTVIWDQVKDNKPYTYASPRYHSMY